MLVTASHSKFGLFQRGFDPLRNSAVSHLPLCLGCLVPPLSTNMSSRFCPGKFFSNVFKGVHNLVNNKHCLSKLGNKHMPILEAFPFQGCQFKST